MTVRLIRGDCRDVLPTLPAGSAQCCVTSPPYFGLRDYGTAEWSGGDPGCDHSARRHDPRADRPRHGLTGGTETVEVATVYRDRCLRCGAVRSDGQIGAEPDPDAYVAALVDVFRAVRRVLRPDGTLWLNLGDSYAGGKIGRGDGGRPATMVARGRNGALIPSGYSNPQDGSGVPRAVPAGYKPRVAFALQADGWWLRSAIVWHKPNPMPESVRDRPTSAYEMVFLMTAAERYYYDADAIAEPAATADHHARYAAASKGYVAKYKNVGGQSPQTNGAMMGCGDAGRRNARNVWTIATAPSSIGHFALMPPALADRCIRAGSRSGDTVLDPFAGAGTTGLVADRLGRDAVLIDLSAGYTDAGRDRIKGDCPLFADVTRSAPDVTAPA